MVLNWQMCSHMVIFHYCFIIGVCFSFLCFTRIYTDISKCLMLAAAAKKII